MTLSQPLQGLLDTSQAGHSPNQRRHAIGQKNCNVQRVVEKGRSRLRVNGKCRMPTEIGLSTHRFLSLLASLDADTVRISQVGFADAVRIDPVGATDRVAMIAPMRV